MDERSSKVNVFLLAIVMITIQKHSRILIFFSNLEAIACLKARLCNIRCDVFVSDDVVDEHNKNVTLDNQVKKNTSTAAKAAAADIEAADVEGEKTLRYGFAFTSAAA